MKEIQDEKNWVGTAAIAALVIGSVLTFSGCQSYSTIEHPDGRVEKISEADAVMRGQAKIAEQRKQAAPVSGILTPAQLSQLGKQAQANYMDQLPMLMMAGIVTNLTNPKEVKGIEATAYFSAQKAKYMTVGGTTKAIAGFGLAAYGIKSLNDFMTSAFSGAGDSFTTNVSDNTINANAGSGGTAAEGGVTGSGGNAAINLGGMQATDGSSMIKGNGNTPFYLQDGAILQQNEKGNVGDGDVNDNDNVQVDDVGVI